MSPGSPPWTNLRGRRAAQPPIPTPQGHLANNHEPRNPQKPLQPSSGTLGVHHLQSANPLFFTCFLLHQPATLGPDVGSWKQRGPLGGRSPACPSSYTPPATDNPAPPPWWPQAGHVTAFPAGLPPTTLATLKLPLHLPVTEDQWYCHQKALNKRQTTWGSDTES